MANAETVLSSSAPLDSAGARSLLERIVGLAANDRERSIVVFDLDSTLLNNAPRQARIMREYAADHGVAKLEVVRGDHWAGWDARIPMQRAGLSEDEIETHFEPFRDYWKERFFTSEFCTDDTAIVGAPEYVDAVLATGARVYYVTGRHEPMRAGTVTSFERAGLAVPNGDRVHLLMKPTLDEHDDTYKLRTHAHLREVGDVVAAFDNEPAHINGYAEAFPHALAVHLATDHSLRQIRVAQGIPSIRDFSCWLERPR